MKELDTLQKMFDFLAAIINRADQRFRGAEREMDGWDSYLHHVMKRYASTYEPPSEQWAEIKAKVQQEVALNQIRSYVP